MSTTFRIQGVSSPTGVSLRARLYNPDGTTAGDCALTESPSGSGQYGGSASLSGLADSTTAPYECEVREVATQDAAGFTGSTTIRRSRGEYGYLSSEAWYPTNKPVPTAAENAVAVRTNLATELGRIDDSVSSRATHEDVEEVSGDLNISAEGNSYSASDE